MNYFLGVGRITTDLKLQQTQDNQNSYCKFTIAIDNQGKDTDFINCVCWNKLAQNLCEYQTKGNLIAISGRLHTYSYTTTNGEKKYSYDVEISKLTYLESKKDKKEQPKEKEEEYDPFLEFQKQIDNQVEIDDSFLD